MPCFCFSQRTIHVKCPLQDSVFCSDKKGCTFDGTALSHSSITVKENKHDFMVIFHTVEGIKLIFSTTKHVISHKTPTIQLTVWIKYLLAKTILVERHKKNLTVCVIQKHFNELGKAFKVPALNLQKQSLIYPALCQMIDGICVYVCVVKMAIRTPQFGVKIIWCGTPLLVWHPPAELKGKFLWRYSEWQNSAAHS